jgi:hypothetical protein
VDAIERRAAWVAVTLAIVLWPTATGSLAFALGGTGKWEVVVHIVGVICLALSALLLVVTIAPDFMRPFTLDERARFVFFAFALVAVAIVAEAVLATHAAIEVYRHPNG